MKKKTRNILFIIIGSLAVLFFYGKHNFENDKQSLLVLKTRSGNGDVNYALQQMENIEGFSNPLINQSYQKWKTKMQTRFITKDENIENTSGNKIVNDISNIYRDYWRTELLKEKPENRTDAVLYNNLTDYLVSNLLTTISKDSLIQTIKNDVELKRIIEDQGFKTKFLYRNGFQEVIIWDEETVNNYKVALPKDTINTTVVFIENYHLNGYDHFASIGSSQVGGWAIKESATLYCNKGEYDLGSEKFKVSYLKHESIHFTDMNQYPNLGSTDLEYRAKIIELMHCTEKTVYDRIADFLNGAGSEDRSHSHPYANYSIIKDMSKLLFNSEYESEFDKWKKLSVDTINNAASRLYKESEDKLIKDNNLTEII